VTGAGAVKVGSDLSVQMKKEGKAKVFAGGDILDTPRTVVHAIGEGKKAAIAIDCVRKGVDFAELLPTISLGDGGAVSFGLYMGWKNISENPFDNKAVVTPEKIKYDYIEKAPQVEVKVASALKRNKNFNPYVEGFDKSAAVQEAKRCMHCGRCMECDNCVIFCPDASVSAQKGKPYSYAFEYDYCKGCLVCAEECPCGVILSKRES
jgi:Pyruvate/2-oxoacid:ferredoxin oxidoreductase delta subunit